MQSSNRHRQSSPLTAWEDRSRPRAHHAVDSTRISNNPNYFTGPKGAPLLVFWTLPKLFRDQESTQKFHSDCTKFKIFFSLQSLLPPLLSLSTDQLYACVSAQAAVFVRFVARFDLSWSEDSEFQFRWIEFVELIIGWGVRGIFVFWGNLLLGCGVLLSMRNLGFGCSQPALGLRIECGLCLVLHGGPDWSGKLGALILFLNKVSFFFPSHIIFGRGLILGFWRFCMFIDWRVSIKITTWRSSCTVVVCKSRITIDWGWRCWERKMFYSQFILAKKGPLGTIWIAAHLERKLRKNQVADTDIGVSVGKVFIIYQL